MLNSVEHEKSFITSRPGNSVNIVKLGADKSEQTAQTQIRLLFKESDQGLH